MERSSEESELLDLVAQLRGFAAADYPDTVAVASLRWRIAEALVEHCAAKDRAATEAPEEVAARRRADHAALCCVFAHYIADWSVARIAAEWGCFGRDTRDVIAALLNVVQAGEPDQLEVRRAA